MACSTALTPTIQRLQPNNRLQRIIKGVLGLALTGWACMTEACDGSSFCPPTHLRHAELYPLLCRASTPWDMNFYRPRCARMCPEEFTSIVHDCLHSDPRARPFSITVFDRLSSVIQRAEPLDVEPAHPTTEVSAHQRPESVGAGRGHDAQQAQHGDCDMADQTESLTSDSLELDPLIDPNTTIGEHLQRLLEIADKRHSQPNREGGEIWSTWYHPEGAAEQDHRLEGDASPRFPSGESHGEGDHTVEGASLGEETGSRGVGCLALPCFARFRAA